MLAPAPSVASGDPFNESCAELESSLGQLCSLCHTIESNVSASPALAQESSEALLFGPHGHLIDVREELGRLSRQLDRLETLLGTCDEDVALLSEVVQQTKGKASIRGRPVDPRLWGEREQFVGEAAQKLHAAREFLENTRRRVEHRAVTLNERNPDGGGARDQATDDAIHGNLEQQMAERKVQDQAITRIHGGLLSLKEKATLIGGEVAEQERMLDEVDSKVTGISGRLRMMNKRVNEVLEGMSAKKKTCLIVFLVFILGILLAVLFTS